MSTGLPVSRLIKVSVTLTPAGAQFANLKSLLILGDSDVIDTQERIRSYSDPDDIALAFGGNSPEYLASLPYFSQSPAPTQVYVGKWAQAATAGRVLGAQLTAAQQLLANFTGIANGALKLQIDGAAAVTISNLNFAACANLNAVAAVINAALAGATCTWDGARFIIKSTSTGAASTIGYPTAPAAGTDLKTPLLLTAALGARKVDGIVAETALAAVQILDALPTFWYGLTLASTHLVDADHLAIAAYIEAAAGPHIYGLTSQVNTVPDAAQNGDIASLLKAGGYKRTFGQWSSTNPYAVTSIFGRLLTVNYDGENTTINVMYQPEPGIVAESLITGQADAMDNKRINYSGLYANGVAVLQNGVMFGPAYIDEIAGSDWLANYVQTNLFNLLATIGTKVAQTDAGTVQLLTNIEKSMAQGVRNGLLAPGTWTSGGFGQLALGDFMPKGFYVYAPPVAQQAQGDRAARKSVPIQIGGKLAGAVNTADLSISVNR